MTEKKEIEFECGRCWESKKDKHSTFRTRDWDSYTETDEDGELYVDIETHCPKCKYYCHRRYYLNQLFEMVFELQEEIRQLKNE